MARHRLFDARRSPHWYARMQPSGNLTHWITLWITSTSPTGHTFSELVPVKVPAQQFNWHTENDRSPL